MLPTSERAIILKFFKRLPPVMKERKFENYEKFVEYSNDKNLKNNIQNKINNLMKKLPKEEDTQQ